MRKILKDKRLWIFLGITLIFFGGMTKIEYSTDSYLFFVEPWRNLFIHFCSLGRFTSAFFWLLLCKTSFKTMYIISYIISLIATTFSIYELDKLLKKDIKNQFITALISVLIVINAFSLELMLFYEKGILAIAVLLNILAVKRLDCAFETKEKKHFIMCFIYMLIAYFSYQGTVALFIALRSNIYIKIFKRYKGFYYKKYTNRIIIWYTCNP